MSLPPTTPARSVHSRTATSDRPAPRARARRGSRAAPLDVTAIARSTASARSRAASGRRRSAERCARLRPQRRGVQGSRLAVHLVLSARAPVRRARAEILSILSISGRATAHGCPAPFGPKALDGCTPADCLRAPDAIGRSRAVVGTLGRMTWLVTGGAGYIGSHVVRAFGQVGLGDGGPRRPVQRAPGVRPRRRAAGRGLDPRHRPRGGHAGPARRRRRRAPRRVQVRRRLGRPPPAHVRAERHRHGAPARGDGLAGRRRDRVLVVGRRLRHPGRRPGHRGHADRPGVARTASPSSSASGCCATRAGPSGLRHTSLRYFNVVGSATPDLYDTSPHNLFPLVLDALAEGRTPRINGTDYATPDGTCVRDYIHVADLADSHVAAAQALAAGRTLEPVYNLGSGDGVSVREIMTAMAEGTGIPFEPEIAPRRPGDPARIVASGRAGRPRPRLADAPLAARHGHQRLGGPPGPLTRASARWRLRAPAARAAASTRPSSTDSLPGVDRPRRAASARPRR